jgi:phage gp36-like protein
LSQYLTAAEFEDRTTAPPELVAWCESRKAGWVLAQIQAASGWIDARLRKRYHAPFDAPPEVVKGWTADIVTRRAYLFRGLDSTDEQSVEVFRDAERARAEVLEAADGKDAHFDLPLRTNSQTSAIRKGGTFAYTEASPYVGFDQQRVTGRDEDRNGYGTES